MSTLEPDSTRRTARDTAYEEPDPSWARLYRWGGVCALLYILLAIVIPLGLVLAPGYDFELTGGELLEHVAANRVWWLIVQGLVLGPSVLAMVTFAALFAATIHLDRAMAAVGALFTLTSQVLFLAYFPVVNGLAYLSADYESAAPERRAALEGGAEALVAMNNAYGPSDTLIGVGILFFSLAMLKGFFSRPLAYLGIATLVAAVVGAALKPILGAAYLWWWVLFVVWFAAVGFRLLQIGRLSASSMALDGTR